MLTPLVVIAIVVLFIGGAVFFISRARRRRAIEAQERLEEAPVTEEQIEQTIREEVAPNHRPYAGGEFGNDTAGRSYVADINGSIRRVLIVDTPDGPGIMSIRKLNKPERKARKRQIRDARRAAQTQ